MKALLLNLVFKECYYEKTYKITTKNDEIVKISDNIKEIINVDDYENSDEIFSAIEKYYLKNNGKCS